jgi:hypothetical protein
MRTLIHSAAGQLQQSQLPTRTQFEDIRLDEMDEQELFYYATLLSRFTNQEGRRLDSNETAILTRQLEFVRTKVFEVQYAALLALSFLPLMTDLPSWVSNVIQVVYDGTGQARIIGNAGSDDIPRVGVTASEQTVKVVSVAASYAFMLMELRTAIGTGIPLTDRKSLLARRVVDAALDELLATGSLSTLQIPQANTGMTGFINASAVPVFTTAAGSWAAATADAIIKDMTGIINTPSQTTTQIFAATNVVMAPQKYDYLAVTPRSTNSDTTILEFLRKVNPGVSFDKWHRLTGAGAGGKDRVIAYTKSPEVIEGIVPITFEQLPPETRGFETSVIVHARCGGVDWHQPKAGVYADPTT